MATTGVYDMTDTWNNGATTFTAIKMDVTDSASAAASKLIDMQIGSASKFEVGKDGATTISSAAADAVAVGLNGATNPVFQVNAATASVATGVLVTGAAAAAGVAVAAISSGTNEAMTVDAKGSGTLTLNSTATGNVVAGQNLSLSAGLIGSVQSLSGAGAVNVTTLTTAVTTTGADALTLADGVAGQIKHIVMVVDGGDGVLTPTNFGNGSTITFADAGDAVTLQFLASNWWIVGSNGAPAIA